MDALALKDNKHFEFTLCSTSIADEPTRCAEERAHASRYRPIGLM